MDKEQAIEYLSNELMEEGLSEEVYEFFLKLIENGMDEDSSLAKITENLGIVFVVV